MFDCIANYDTDIARYEVSDDGVTWRPYDAARDTGGLLHTRMFFADPQQAGQSNLEMSPKA